MGRSILRQRREAPRQPNVSDAQSDGELVEGWLRARKRGQTNRNDKRVAEWLFGLPATRGQSLQSLPVADLQDFIDSLRGAASTRSTAANGANSPLSSGHRNGHLRVNVGGANEAPARVRRLAVRILTEAEVREKIAAEKELPNKVIVRLQYVSVMRRA